MNMNSHRMDMQMVNSLHFSVANQLSHRSCEFKDKIYLVFFGSIKYTWHLLKYAWPS